MTLGVNRHGGLIRELSIAVDHPSFAGHFPGFPVLPGAVLLDEALKHIVLAHRLDLTRWHLAAAKFLEPVRPGDRLTLEFAAPLVEFAAPLNALKFTIRRTNAVVVTGTLSPTGQPEPVHGH